MLSPGRRTVASALRAIGLHSDKSFGSYHRLLSRDRWSAMLISKKLLSLLLETFIPLDQPVDLFADETLERRRGRKIAYKGWFRDAIASTQARTVTTLGIRWLCICVLVQPPWSNRRWALPFLILPSLSKKTCAKQNRTYRGTDGLIINCLIKVRQWLGQDRDIRHIADGGFSHIETLLFAISYNVTHIGRLQINAGLYDEPGEQPAKKSGPRPKKGGRQIGLQQRLADPGTKWQTLDLPIYEGKARTVQLISDISLWYVKGNDPVELRWVLVRPAEGKSGQAAAFFSTDPDMTPEQIVLLYAERWNIEVFFEEVRACMGFETQRGWSNRTIGRSTPCLFGIFTLVVILAKRLFPEGLPIRQAAWYPKEQATFRDVLCAVREHLWTSGFAIPDPKSTSHNTGGSSIYTDHRLIPAYLFAAMQEMACYAA
jgi:hypothetical protein